MVQGHHKNDLQYKPRIGTVILWEGEAQRPHCRQYGRWAAGGDTKGILIRMLSPGRRCWEEQKGEDSFKIL
jgi:hypothetical protein